MLKKFFVIIVLVSLISQSLLAQEKKPKLVVLIVCDQLAEELMLRYQPYFGDKGFNLLINRGAYFTNARYGYAYTKTGPGHATIATGSYSDMHGVVGNSWYDRVAKKTVNCVEDDSVQTIGGEGDPRSPRVLKTYTFGDMLRLYTNFRSKVISVSNKDRAAILMGGKLGTAYWEGKGGFITSSYYMKSLPSWVTSFNSSGIFGSYFGKTWDLLLPDVANKICDSDSNNYEANNSGSGITFPHLIKGKNNKIDDTYYDAIDMSPYGTELLLDFARKAAVAESLGCHETTDMLCVGISATDEIGHEYGPHSYEVFDNLLRTDAYLAEFFSFLDKQVGLYNCVIALTADHGIAPIPEYITKKDSNADAGRISGKKIRAAAEQYLTNVYGADSLKWIKEVAECNLYLNYKTLQEKALSLDTVLQTLKDSLTASLPVFAAYSRNDLMKNSFPDKIRRQVELSYYPSRSGDLSFVLKPYWILDGTTKGTTHGSPWDYDAHVPLMIFGNNITPGIYLDEVAPVDLMPTLAALLKIEFPPSREGRVLKEVMK